jgi:hypothetical protein
MTATHTTDSTVSNAPLLYMALDLGTRDWKVACTVGLGQKPRLKTITARSALSLVLEIKAAKRRFGLPEDAPVICCYEAGATVFGSIASCWPMESRTMSLIPRASRSIAGREGRNRIASTQ